MDKKINRWLVLAASTAILLCTSAVYAFSTFAQPLSDGNVTLRYCENVA